MKAILFLVFALVLTGANAQRAERVYVSGPQLNIADANGENVKGYLYSSSNTEASVSVYSSTYIQVTTGRGNYRYYTPAQFLNQSGTAYSTVSASAAVNAFFASLPATGGGSSGSVDATAAKDSASKALSLLATATNAIASRVVHVADIASLTATAGVGVTSVLVRDASRGGAFTYSASGTIDNGLVFPALGGGVWVRTVANQNYYFKWWNPDTTGAANMTPLLTSVIAGLPAKSNLFLSSNRLAINTQLAITNSVNLLSERNNTKLVISGTFSPSITFAGVAGVRVEGLEIYKATSLAASTMVLFDNSTDVTFTRNYLHDGGGGVTFRKSSKLTISNNRIENTNLSGIRFNKSGNANSDACFDVQVLSNYLKNNDYSGTGGNGGIFFGSDGGTGGHSGIKISLNWLYNQGAMCIAMDGKGYDVEVSNNTMFQSTTAEGTETMAFGGGVGTDGLKRLQIRGNYIEQLNTAKVGGGCILLYSNVTDVDVLNNHTKGGPQAFYLHFPFDDSYIANVTVSGNYFENTPQAVLFYKNGANALANAPANLNFINNTFSGITTMLEYSSLSATEQNFRFLDNVVNGKKEVRGINNESIYALPKSNFLGQYTTTGSLTTQYGGIYQVRPFSTGNATNVLIGASAALSNPDQRFAGLNVNLSGVSYNTVKVSLQASNNTVRKDVTTAALEIGDVPVLSVPGGFNTGLLKIGSFYLWDDGTGKLRYKTTLPASAIDGTALF